MKKRVTIFSYNLGYGGIEREVVSLANSLVSLYDVNLVFLKSNNINHFDIDKKVKLVILDINSINIFNSSVIKKLVRNSSNDVLISTDNMFNKYILKANDSNKIYWEHSFIDSNVEIDFLKKSVEGFDKVVVSNELSLDIYKKVFKNVVCIPNFIESVPVESSNLKNKNITFIGKLETSKCVDELIEIFKIVHSKDKNSKLFIIGEGSKRNELELLVKKYKLNNSIQFMGSLNKDEINNVLMNTKVFATCSKKESFGLSIIEAMSYGIPPVAFSDVYSFNKLIDNEINGILINNRDKNEMALSIINLLNDDEFAQQIGACAKEKSSLFDINSIKNDWIKIL